MKITEFSSINPVKIDELRERIARLKIDISQVTEQFSRGGGKGGQKINKTSNRVQLKYSPLSIIVQCQRERKRSVNRFLALRELVDRIEMEVSPETSARLKEMERIRKNKARYKSRFSKSIQDRPPC